MTKVWVKEDATPEGKYLVVRRDGTTPVWPHFVIAASDPAAPHALRSYAGAAEEYGFAEDYVESVGQLADDYEGYVLPDDHKAADPDHGPHREDLPLAISLMQRRFDLRDVAAVMTVARDQFLFYERQHLDKDTPESREKAVVNAEMASRLTELLTAWGPPE